jgi:hypothetical protein
MSQLSLIGQLEPIGDEVPQDEVAATLQAKARQFEAMQVAEKLKWQLHADAVYEKTLSELPENLTDTLDPAEVMAAVVGNMSRTKKAPSLWDKVKSPENVDALEVMRRQHAANVARLAATDAWKVAESAANSAVGYYMSARFSAGQAAAQEDEKLERRRRKQQKRRKQRKMAQAAAVAVAHGAASSAADSAAIAIAATLEAAEKIESAASAAASAAVAAISADADAERQSQFATRTVILFACEIAITAAESAAKFAVQCANTAILDFNRMVNAATVAGSAAMYVAAAAAAEAIKTSTSAGAIADELTKKKNAKTAFKRSRRATAAASWVAAHAAAESLQKAQEAGMAAYCVEAAMADIRRAPQQRQADGVRAPRTQPMIITLLEEMDKLAEINAGLRNPELHATIATNRTVYSHDETAEGNGDDKQGTKEAKAAANTKEGRAAARAELRCRVILTLVQELDRNVKEGNSMRKAMDEAVDEEGRALPLRQKVTAGASIVEAKRGETLSSMTQLASCMSESKAKNCLLTCMLNELKSFRSPSDSPVFLKGQAYSVDEIAAMEREEDEKRLRELLDGNSQGVQTGEHGTGGDFLEVRALQQAALAAAANLEEAARAEEAKRMERSLGGGFGLMGFSGMQSKPEQQRQQQLPEEASARNEVSVIPAQQPSTAEQDLGEELQQMRALQQAALAAAANLQQAAKLEDANEASTFSTTAFSTSAFSKPSQQPNSHEAQNIAARIGINSPIRRVAQFFGGSGLKAPPPPGAQAEDEGVEMTPPLLERAEGADGLGVANLLQSAGYHPEEARRIEQQLQLSTASLVGQGINLSPIKQPGHGSEKKEDEEEQEQNTQEQEQEEEDERDVFGAKVMRPQKKKSAKSPNAKSVSPLKKRVGKPAPPIHSPPQHQALLAAGVKPGASALENGTGPAVPAGSPSGTSAITLVIDRDFMHMLQTFGANRVMDARESLARFEQVLVADLSIATRVPHARFKVHSLESGSIVASIVIAPPTIAPCTVVVSGFGSLPSPAVTVQPPKTAMELRTELLEQASDPKSALYRGQITRDIDVAKTKARPENKPNQQQQQQQQQQQPSPVKPVPNIGVPAGDIRRYLSPKSHKHTAVEDGYIADAERARERAAELGRSIKELERKAKAASDAKLAIHLVKTVSASAADVSMAAATAGVHAAAQAMIAVTKLVATAQAMDAQRHWAEEQEAMRLEEEWKTAEEEKKRKKAELRAAEEAEQRARRAALASPVSRKRFLGHDQSPGQQQPPPPLSDPPQPKASFAPTSPAPPPPRIGMPPTSTASPDRAPQQQADNEPHFSVILGNLELSSFPEGSAERSMLVAGLLRDISAAVGVGPKSPSRRNRRPKSPKPKDPMDPWDDTVHQFNPDQHSAPEEDAPPPPRFTVVSLSPGSVVVGMRVLPPPPPIASPRRRKYWEDPDGDSDDEDSGPSVAELMRRVVVQLEDPDSMIYRGEYTRFTDRLRTLEALAVARQQAKARREQQQQQQQQQQHHHHQQQEHHHQQQTPLVTPKPTPWHPTPTNSAVSTAPGSANSAYAAPSTATTAPFTPYSPKSPARDQMATVSGTTASTSGAGGAPTPPFRLGFAQYAQRMAAVQRDAMQRQGQAHFSTPQMQPAQLPQTLGQTLSQQQAAAPSVPSVPPPPPADSAMPMSPPQVQMAFAFALASAQMASKTTAANASAIGAAAGAAAYAADVAQQASQSITSAPSRRAELVSR